MFSNAQREIENEKGYYERFLKFDQDMNRRQQLLINQKTSKPLLNQPFDADEQGRNFSKSPVRDRDIHGHVVTLSGSQKTGLENVRKFEGANPLLNAGEQNVFDSAQRFVRREQQLAVRRALETQI